MNLEEYERYELAMSKRKSEVDIDSMTIEEYELYMAMQCSNTSGLHNRIHGFTSQFVNQSLHTHNPLLDEMNLSLEEILGDLFRIGAENLRRREQEVSNVCDDKKSGDTDQEDGDLLDFPIFIVTNVFASVCEQVKENINVSIENEKEEVHMKDVEMDENHDVDHLKTNEELQWYLTKDNVLVFMEPKDHWQYNTPSSISNKVKREFTIPRSKGKEECYRLSSWLSGVAVIKELRCSWVPRLRRSWSFNSKSFPDLRFGISFLVATKGDAN
ncbi:hypothetical protein Tco_0304798 [Tanacetum coccineum]